MGQKKTLTITNTKSESKGDLVKGGDPERGHWTGKLDFLLSGIGYAVGLGNVWRFPFLCFRNGGASFLIPYLIMLIFVALPIFLMELSIGQYASLGPNKLYANAVPIFKGVGVGMAIVSGIVSIYYNMIIAWSIFYFFASFTSDLPWQYCNREWTTNKCYSHRDYLACKELNDTIYVNATCLNATEHPGVTDVNTTETVSAAEEYFRYYMLGQSNGIDEMGEVRWQLILCMLGAWFIIFFSLVKGVQSSGKVVYVTATLPYVVLFILLIRGATLPGAIKGIKFYMIPNMTKLTEINVWQDAASQIFYSTSVAWGGLITLSSYNHFSNNAFRDTLVICIGNCATSVFAGFVIFSILGFMAQERGVNIEDVAVAGSGLAFIAYPDALTRLPISPLWAILFFLMLITLGLDSEFGSVETVTTAIFDEWPHLRRKKWLVVLITCVVMFLLGIPLTMNGGIYLLELMNDFPSGYPLLCLGIMECIVLGWIYGADRLLDNIYEMIKYRPNYYWKYCWKFVSPIITCIILIISLYKWKPYEYDGHIYPVGANIFAWILVFIPLSAIPFYIFYQPYRTKQSFKELLKPNENWGPEHELAARQSMAMTSPVTVSSVERGAYENPAGPTQTDNGVPPAYPSLSNGAYDNTAADLSADGKDKY